MSKALDEDHTNIIVAGIERFTLYEANTKFVQISDKVRNLVVYDDDEMVVKALNEIIAETTHLKKTEILKRLSSRKDTSDTNIDSLIRKVIKSENTLITSVVYNHALHLAILSTKQDMEEERQRELENLRVLQKLEEQKQIIEEQARQVRNEKKFRTFTLNNGLLGVSKPNVKTRQVPKNLTARKQFEDEEIRNNDNNDNDDMIM